MRRLVLIVTFLWSICAALLACDGGNTPPPSAGEVLTVMTDTLRSPPDGLLYTRSADPAGPNYLTDTFFSALYGEAARGLLESVSSADGVAAVGDVAMFLSVAPYPCELAVFRCSDIRTAATVAGLCRGRLDTVTRGFAGSEWQEIAEGGRVAVKGCYVVLVIAEDAETVTERVLRML